MAIKRVQKKIDWTQEDRRRHEAIREKFSDKPTIDELVAQGELSGQPVTLSTYLNLRVIVRNLRVLREQSRLSLADLSERTGMDKAMLSRLENGRVANPGIETIARYLDALDKSLEWRIVESPPSQPRKVNRGKSVSPLAPPRVETRDRGTEPSSVPWPLTSQHRPVYARPSLPYTILTPAAGRPPQCRSLTAALRKLTRPYSHHLPEGLSVLTFWGAKHRFCDRLSRRDFLRAGALGLGGLALPDILRLQAETKGRSPRAVIMVCLAGGPSHLDPYDMKPDAPADYRGEFKPIRTNVPGFDLCEHMPLQAKIADKLALVRTVQFVEPMQHELEEVYTGFPKSAKRPSFGSVISRYKGGNGRLPSYVSLEYNTGTSTYESPQYIGAAHRPLQLAGSAGVRNLSLPYGMSRAVWKTAAGC